MNTRVIIRIIALYYVIRYLIYLSLTIDNIPYNIKISFLSVGQGDASIIDVNNKPIIVIDGGTDSTIERYINNIEYYPYCNINSIYLSHFHEDHFAGLKNIIKRCAYSLKILNLPSTFNDILLFSYSSNLFSQKILEKNVSNLKNIKIETLSKNNIIRYYINDTNVFYIYVLWPENNSELIEDENDRSLILLLDYGSFEILYTGDASGQILDKVLTPEILSLIQDGLDIYKVPHHGSITGKSESVLSKLKPKDCIISVGKNSFGHPSQDILNDLEKNGCNIRRTDVEGDIEYLR